MKIVLPILLALALIGCSGGSDAPKDDSKPAPAVSYKMVPATTGGGGSASPAPTPGVGAAPKGNNPASPGSD